MFPYTSKVYSYTNPDYLEANRQGKINPEQVQILGPARKFLTGKFQWKSKTSGIAVIGALIFLGAAQLIGIELTTPILMAVFGLVLVVLALQLGSRMVNARRQEDQIEKDLQRGEVRQAIGRLQFSGKGYQIALPGQQLQLLFGGREDLVPGVAYRFYYLPSSGLVLSAEPQEEIIPDAVESGLTRTLAEANRFKLDALQANRRGELAVEQISRLLSFLVAPLVFLLLPGGILYYQLQKGGYLQGSSVLGILTNLGRIYQP